MIITNKLNLPKPLVDAASGFIRKPPTGNISVTELIGPALIRILKKKHWNDLTTDVSEMIWALFGSSIHAILEKADTTNHLAEERLFSKVKGWVISGQSDLLSPDGVLTDYKVTSVWAAKSEKKDWEYQLNLYRWLYLVHGFDTRRMEVIALLRDWQNSRAMNDKDYPQVQVVNRLIPVMDDIESYIFDRVEIHQDAEKGNYKPCTNEERWHRPDTWAVMKKGRKRALRVFQNEPEAKDYLNSQDKNCHIEFRPGRDIRCESYCPVREFCPEKREDTSNGTNGTD